MKQRKWISALLFAGVGITQTGSVTGAPESDPGAEQQPPQSAFDRMAEPPSAPPPPGPFRAPLPGASQDPDRMSTRMDREPPFHARPKRPEFHRGSLFGTEQQPAAATPGPQQAPPTRPEPNMATSGWHPEPPPPFQRRIPPWAQGGDKTPAPEPGQQAAAAEPSPDEKTAAVTTRGWYREPPTPPFQRRMPPWAQGGHRTPPPEPEQQTATAAPSAEEKAAAPEAPAWAGAPPSGFGWPSQAGGQRTPYWRDSRQSPPGLSQSRSPWAPTPEETGQDQQPAGYPPAAYMPPNFPPPPPMASQQPYFYPGQGYSAPAGVSPAQPTAVPGYYGAAPWGGSPYSRPYPPPYPYGPGARNW
jgi:hypothetical protein